MLWPSSAADHFRSTLSQLLREYKIQHAAIDSQNLQIRKQEQVQATLRDELAQLQGGGKAMMVNSRRVDDSTVSEAHTIDQINPRVWLTKFCLWS